MIELYFTLGHFCNCMSVVSFVTCNKLIALTSYEQQWVKITKRDHLSHDKLGHLSQLTED